MNTKEKYEKYIMNTYSRCPAVLKEGKECTVTDEDNKKYIDMGSGIGTNSLGYNDDKWVENVCNQVKSIQHSSNYYYTKVQGDFAEKLCNITGYKKVFFGNSGAEANECAIKIARKYSFDKYGKDAKRYKIVTLENSFHGRTIATLSATGQDVFHNYFFPFLEGFETVPAHDVSALEKAFDDKCCAVMLEFIQGEGGVNVLDKEYVQKLFEMAQKKDILVIADEVQTGVGRTGTFLTSEQYGIKPDITTLAKGIAGGIPMGAALAGEKAENVMTPGMHGSTFGGNPIACAGGLAVLEKVSSAGFLDNVKKKGELLKSELMKIDGIESVCGLGLMVGAVLKEKNAHDVFEKAVDKGLLILTAKEKLRFLPPLTVSEDDIISGVKILKTIIDD